MLAAEITVQNLLGLHARPIAKLVKTLSGCSDRVTLKGAERSADAQDIYQIMALEVKCGDHLTVCVDGPSEAETLNTVVALFNAKFNEA